MNNFPQELMRRYEVNFKCSSDIKPTPVRDVKANCIGKLVSIRGIVTRASEVGLIAIYLTIIKTPFQRVYLVCIDEWVSSHYEAP